VAARAGTTTPTFPAGPLALKNIADLYMYPNTVKAMLLTGAQVREWIEMSAGQFRRIDPKGAARQPLLDEGFRSYNFDTLDGVSYELDLTQPARYTGNGALAAPDAHRVQNLRYQGKPVEPADALHRRDQQLPCLRRWQLPRPGGGQRGARCARREPPGAGRLPRADSAAGEKGGQFNPSADGNWKIQPVPGVAMTFLTGSGAKRYVARHPGIKFVQDNDDGSAMFELVN
jgi:2',3'-cyclic-nucleotide 2'-phosphodiesterase/3'-nucleotidase